jgi:hypothetical protein
MLYGLTQALTCVDLRLGLSCGGCRLDADFLIIMATLSIQNLSSSQQLWIIIMIFQQGLNALAILFQAGVAYWGGGRPFTSTNPVPV